MLGRGLGLAVKRDRRSRRFFVADVIGDGAVDAAGGGEQEPGVGLAELEQVPGALDVDRLRELGLLLAGGIADDGGEVNDRLHAVHGRPGGGGIADIALHQLEEAILTAGQEPVTAELEVVQHPDAVPLFQQQWNQG